MNSHQTRAIVRIREMILRGELAAGARVAEAPLAQLLGMSRTPVRQALPVLAQEGLLGEHETRGYVVRGFSSADILDAVDLRGVLEGLAARRVAERGASRALLQALRVCLADGDRSEEQRLNSSHDQISYAVFCLKKKKKKKGMQGIKRETATRPTAHDSARAHRH